MVWRGVMNCVVWYEVIALREKGKNICKRQSYVSGVVAQHRLGCLGLILTHHHYHFLLLLLLDFHLLHAL